MSPTTTSPIPPIEAPFHLTQADANTLIMALQFTDLHCMSATPAERELEARLLSFAKHHWGKSHGEA